MFTCESICMCGIFSLDSLSCRCGLFEAWLWLHKLSCWAEVHRAANHFRPVSLSRVERVLVGEGCGNVSIWAWALALVSILHL